MLSSTEIRKRFLAFFEKREHVILPSAPLVPENDPTVLFNTAGMQPLVPYLMGREHPSGDKLADVQKCVRTGDIDDIGDNTHLTFFEMLGNWSLGAYFKEDAIKWSFELLTNKEEGFGLDPKRLYVTVFAGDENAPKDEEAARIWESVGMPKHRIYFKDASANWWPAVKGKDTWTGPTGPCSEMFYDLTPDGLGDLSPEEYNKADEEQKIVEIWNDVFMEYEKRDGKIVGKLAKKNVDTGAGLERITAVLQNKNNVFDTDIFSGVMAITIPMAYSLKNHRLIADHIRSSCFLISDGVLPSNTDQGYVLRRLIRRATFATNNKKISKEEVISFVEIISNKYKDIYPNIHNQKEKIVSTLFEESKKFSDSLLSGVAEKILDKDPSPQLTAVAAFNLSTSHGYPLEVAKEVALKFGKRPEPNFDINYGNLVERHKELSRAGAEQKFKGGLADTSDKSLQYHTATHLLHMALRKVLGEHVQQKGSNITPERLRFDFAHTGKMTNDEKKAVEKIVNEAIGAALPMQQIILPKAEAEKTGALHFFGEKYGDQISVYFVGNSIDTAISKEFCGGPHVKNTSDLKGTFKISKEEAVSAGVRRIKAVIE